MSKNLYNETTRKATHIHNIPIESGTPTDEDILVYDSTTNRWNTEAQDNVLGLIRDPDAPFAYASVIASGVTGLEIGITGASFAYFGYGPTGDSGTRLKWDQGMGAFRAGRADGSQWNSSNIGRYSSGFGLDTTASGYISHAEGRLTTASGGYGAHAEGLSSTASGYASHAEGQNSIASTFRAHAEGWGGTASGIASHAEGKDSTASGYASHAEGYTPISSGISSHAEGYSTISSNTASHAEGYTTNASGLYTHAEGQSTIASNSRAHAEGWGGTASGIASHAEGKNTTASGDYSHAEGAFTTASGTYSHAEGMTGTASGTRSHVEGWANVASGPASHAEGLYNTASGAYSHSEGSVTTASGHRSHAEGWSAISSGLGSHAEGKSTTASGIYSHAEGHSTSATQIRAHAEGWSTTASANSAHAEGKSTTASAVYTHAEGQNSTANGTFGHAEGFYTTASGSRAHAEGESSVASATASHAEGLATTASGIQSHAEGNYTRATADGSHSEGKSTMASGTYSHAEGWGGTAQVSSSHVSGYFTTAYSVGGTGEGRFVCGRANDDSAPFAYSTGLQYWTAGGTGPTGGYPDIANSERMFVVGGGTYNGTSGTLVNLFSVTADGYAHIQNGITLGSADYAEYIESVDGRSIPVGTSVILENGKVRPALPGEQPIGVVSKTYAILGNAYENEWSGKYLKDEYGRRIYETRDVKTEHIKTTKEIRVEPKTIEIYDELNDRYISKTIAENVEYDIPVYREIAIYNDQNVLLGTRYEMMKEYRIEKQFVPKLNPLFDPTRTYISRGQRPEWISVGLFGMVIVRKDQPLSPGWIKIKDLGTTELYFIK